MNTMCPWESERGTMKPTTRLPGDIVIEIMLHLDSLEDLKNVILCNREMYAITKMSYWDVIFSTVLLNEWEPNMHLGCTYGHQLRALHELRQGQMPLEKLFDEMSIEDESQDKKIELLKLHRTIRWFSYRCVKDRLVSKNLPGSLEPTRTEISAMGSAFCILWIWMELASRSLENIEWVGTLTGPMSGLLYSRKTKLNISLAVVLHAYSSLQSELSQLTKKYVSLAAKARLMAAIGREHCVHRGMFIPSPFSPNRVLEFRPINKYSITVVVSYALPNLIMIKSGLSNLRNLLENPCNRAKIDSYCPPVLQTRNPPHYRKLTLLLVNFIDQHCKRVDEPSAELCGRPLWSKRDGICNTIRGPWCQTFVDYKDIVLDDTRLRAWGYKTPKVCFYDLWRVDVPPGGRNQAATALGLKYGTCMDCKMQMAEGLAAVMLSRYRYPLNLLHLRSR
ncbi:hypothetical protein TWF481_006170 [Arthrobotrys musiformis]|uniref:F-box domain-containing protein n=1 Tax=Arthrobotrys musiformis TaxID=47236 RepID=A0AAV9WLM6_9PEZI